MKDIIMIEHVAIEAMAEQSHDKLKEMWLRIKKEIEEGKIVRIHNQSPRMIGHGFNDLYDNTTLNIFISRFEKNFSSIIGTKPN